MTPVDLPDTRQDCSFSVHQSTSTTQDRTDYTVYTLLTGGATGSGRLDYTHLPPRCWRAWAGFSAITTLAPAQQISSTS